MHGPSLSEKDLVRRSNPEALHQCNFLYSLVTPPFHGKGSCSERHSIFVIPRMCPTKCHTHIRVQQENYSSVSIFVNKNHNLRLFTFKASPLNVILTCSTIQSTFLGTAVTCYWAGSRRLAEWNWQVVAVANKSVPRWLLLHVVAFCTYQSTVSSALRSTPPSK